MDIKILVCCHKPGRILRHECLLPIHVGKDLSNFDLGIIGDNTGDNISKKNPIYSELTGLYWLWKNVDADYKGLFHYRRCFSYEPNHRLIVIKQTIQQYINKLLFLFRVKKEATISILHKYDNFEEYEDHIKRFCSNLEIELTPDVNVIAPFPITFLTKPTKSHVMYIGGFYMDLLGEIIEQNYPDFYKYYQEATEGNVFYYGNLSIMDKETFNEYCSLLFDVLQKHEEESINRNYVIDLYHERAYSRVPAYLGELLTNAFILYCKEKKKVIEKPVSYLQNG